MSRKVLYTDEEVRDLLLRSSDDEGAEDVSPEILDDSDDDNSEADPDFIPLDTDDDYEVIQAISAAEQQPQPSSSGEGKKAIKTSRKRPVVKTRTGPTLIKFNEKVIPGKNEIFKWEREPKAQGGKVSRRNVVHITPGPANSAKNAYEPIDCFKLFFSEDILDEVFIHTNEEISRQQIEYKTRERTVFEMNDRRELEALIGLIILSAGMKNNHLSTEYLFDSSYCGNNYRATLSERRFKFLLNTLRFDDKETRNNRYEVDKFAPIRKIWDLIIDKCRNLYKPGSYITIDEQLVGFRGRVPFLTYIPSKPNKYGIKIVMACDSSTKYMIDACPYLGKGTVPEGENAGLFFVKKLVETVKGSNRNITVDNWFTSIPMVLELLREMNLTVVGTIKKNKTELPPDFVDVKFNNRSVGSSLFIFHKDLLTAVSYKPKNNKLVTLVSSMHDDDGVDATSGKPQIILTYNQTKGGVDSFDQMCQSMNCGRKTRRWPLCIFYNMLNIACINAYVIYVHNFYRKQKEHQNENPARKKLKTGDKHDKRREMKKERPLSRFEFMISISNELCVHWRRSRLEIPTLSSELKELISGVVGPENLPHQPTLSETKERSSSIGKRTYCKICPYIKHRYTTTYCKKCCIAICGEHQIKICSKCCEK